MPYASLDDLTESFGTALLVQLTDRGAVATGFVDANVIERALLRADEKINGFLHRYQLPIDPVPGLLVDLAQTIAIYKLHRFKPDPKIKDDYDDALKTLRDIAAGVIKLQAAGIEPAPAASGGNGVRITDRERPLTEVNLKGYI